MHHTIELLYLQLVVAGYSVTWQFASPANWYCASQNVGPTERLQPKLCPGSLWAEMKKCNASTADQCKADSSCIWTINATKFYNETVYLQNMNASFGYLNK